MNECFITIVSYSTYYYWNLDEDMLLYLCENPGGALLHFFELTLLKFPQPHPVALEEKSCVCSGIHFSVSHFLHMVLLTAKRFKLF